MTRHAASRTFRLEALRAIRCATPYTLSWVTVSDHAACSQPRNPLGGAARHPVRCPLNRKLEIRLNWRGMQPAARSAWRRCVPSGALPAKAI